jgi:4-amino-4-deoxy-L-arabinose transferase-like glycosyltransferase
MGERFVHAATKNAPQSFSDSPRMKSLSRSSLLIVALAFLAAIAAVLCFLRLDKNPPGYYIDESSISYNAQTIATTGRDEHGVSWPLYFQAFGDFKNPVYIYLLAALFRITGPGMFVARCLSAAAIILAAAVLGHLAAQLTRSRAVGLLITIFALLTPWLFEVAHVVVEVALYPFALALFLLCVHRAAAKSKWRAQEVISLALTLALLTYSYSIGRLLAPLLALGLVLFWTRERWVGIVLTWCGYAITLVPLALYAFKHPGALTERFRIITYLTSDAGVAESAWEFVRHFVRNINPRRLLITGDPNRDQIVHLFGSYQFLAAVFAFTILGLLIVWRQRADSWWRFVLYGAVVSLVPASLTNEHFHMLRLIGVPVFLLVFAIPGVAWFFEREQTGLAKIAFVVLIGTALAQAAVFQWRYQSSWQNPRRVHLFDGEYREKIFRPAIASNAQPIYLADALPIPGYIQAYWYSTLEGIDVSRFQRLPPSEPPPIGTLVIGTEENCPGCEIMATVPPYTLYVARERRPRSPLPLESLRAELSVVSSPGKLRPRALATFRVKVTNRSDATWLARERGGGSYQVALGNHWLDAEGKTLVHDDGRSALLRDLHPGETAELSLTVNTPRTPGAYILEIDMLQESVSWFGLVGSNTLRLPVEVR